MTTEIRKAVITHFASTPSDVANLVVVTATLPTPTKTQVQVRVLYSGFAGADINMALGRYPLQRKAPLTPGYCMIGIITALGPGVTTTSFKVGDYVTAATTYDSEAERINVEEKLLVKVPSELTETDDMLQQVAAACVDWTTALGMVDGRRLKVKEGDVVFIHGLSGAVGQALVSLCLLKGARVFGTASQRNHQKLKGQGVEGVFDYRSKDWIAAMKKMGGVDAAFDPLGFQSYDESFSVLKDGGILVGYGANQNSLSGSEQASPYPSMAKLIVRGMLPFASKRTWFYYIEPGTKEFQESLATIMDMLKDGKIKVTIKAVWDLTTEGLREAHQSWGKVEGMGSLLIRVGAQKV
jgi:synaptic vesicle membrane protein VAT-1